MTQWKNYLKIKDAAEMLGVSELTLRNWDKAGKLHAHRNPINNYRLYRVADIEKFMDKISGSKPRKIMAKLVEED